MPEINHREMPVTGYFDRFSARPGEQLKVYVSVRDGGTYRARLERVISGDPNPEGPGLCFADLSSRFDLTFAGRRQEIHSGSYALLPAPPTGEDERRIWTALAWMARPGKAGVIFSQEDADCRVVILLGAKGAEARIKWPGGHAVLGVDRPVKRRQWVRMWLSANPIDGTLLLGQSTADEAPATVTGRYAGLKLPDGGDCLIAAESRAKPTNHFTGKIEAPSILRGTIADWDDPLTLPANEVLTAWDFSRGIDGLHIFDSGPLRLHGTLRNFPTRGVVGARWSGRETCWRHAPEEYAAIHFHDDDLDDCNWDSDFALSIADDLPSGAYALHLSCNGGEDRLPFYVLPHRNGPHSAVAVLASTFTYQAYANHARGNADARYQARVSDWGASPYNPDEYPVYGRSTYNRHSDNSGIAFSSRRRPILTMRPGFLTFNDARGSGLRHYPADTHLLAWLNAKNIAFDIITDEDLDDEGPSLLLPYRTILTGSHPEYHTLGTLDALQRYTEQGGRLIYLGGNGFYWRIARNPDIPHLIEIRRAEGGIRAWEAEPGEYYNALDGQLGGLWRRNRRPPQLLAGVGFSGQGLFEGTHYRRLPASHAPENAWIFEGVPDEIIGDYGLSGGGAAGFELDRADFDLGTPEGAIILARSEDPPASFVTVPEELLTHTATVSGEAPEQLIRGEIVYFTTPAGGAVFSVGSITFCGSLWKNDSFDGPISRMLENVVRRFARNDT